MAWWIDHVIPNLIPHVADQARMAPSRDSSIAFLIPRCFRRKKSAPVPKATRNVFEDSMTQRLKKQNKRKHVAKHIRQRPPSFESETAFATLDLVAARESSHFAQCAREWKDVPPPAPSLNSAADTYVSFSSSIEPDTGSTFGARQTVSSQSTASDLYASRLVHQQISRDAAFRLQRLAQLDMHNSAASFEYQTPQEEPTARRKWSVVTTEGSAGDYCLLSSR